MQPSSVRSSTRATLRVTVEATRLPASFSPNRSVTGASRRWNERTLACTQPERSVTRTRAGPDWETRPVSCATSSSASRVSSSKSGSSESTWYESPKGSRPPTRTATRSARSQATGCGVTPSAVLRVLERLHLPEVPDDGRDDRKDATGDQRDRDPPGPDDCREHGRGS